MLNMPMLREIRGSRSWLALKGALCAIGSPAIGRSLGRRSCARLGEVRLLF